MARDALKLAEDFDFTIIDGPPQAQAISRSCIVASDLVAVPIEPGGASRWSSDLTVLQLKEAAELRPEVPPVSWLWAAGNLKECARRLALPGLIVIACWVCASKFPTSPAVAIAEAFLVGLVILVVIFFKDEQVRALIEKAGKFIILSWPSARKII